MNYKRFEELPCWKKARELSKYVFKIINSDKFKKDYSLRDQRGELPDQSWTILQKVLMTVQEKNLLDFWDSLSGLVEKFNPNYIVR